jgi:hypothetical protein
MDAIGGSSWRCKVEQPPAASPAVLLTVFIPCRNSSTPLSMVSVPVKLAGAGCVQTQRRIGALIRGYGSIIGHGRPGVPVTGIAES